MTTDITELYKYFTIPCESYEAGIIDSGIVLKFNTFYLKIYDSKKTDSYQVLGYRYYESAPTFDVMIRYNRFKEFASTLNEDNYLRGVSMVSEIECE